MLKIAFINPPHADWCLGNFAAYYMFQSHYKRYGKNTDKVEWLPPPYKYNKYESVEEIYDEVPDADIYLFSSYVWNYNICDHLAKYIKSKRPEAICVVGGPHIGVNDTKFLESRSCYDFMLKATKPGETFVQELIDSYFENNGKPKIEDLSWELRGNKTCDQFLQDYSVYEEHEDFLKEIRNYARENHLEPFMVIETTRGCPYSCTYCEWGGGIGSKIYKKPIDIVHRDLMALKRAGFRDVYLTDANFGAFFERDVGIFKFAWDNGINLTDISTMKSKDVLRRINLVDAWFNVVGVGFERHSPAENPNAGGITAFIGSEAVRGEFVSVVPTVSIQSISDDAMKVADRIDLSVKDKILLSKHIYKRCHEEGYPVPGLELILAMPGSTLDDFYDELQLFWDFKSWTSFRHDYMFLPDCDITKPEYLEKYKIELVEVYTDLVDEQGVDHQNSFYKEKRNYFKTVASSYSFTREECCEMWIMNIAGKYLLQNLYEKFENECTPSKFGKLAFSVIKTLPEFDAIWKEVTDLLNPDTPPGNTKRLQGRLRNDVIDEMIERNQLILYNEIFIKLLEE